MKVVYAENALDLCEEARQEPEIASRHPNQAGDHFRKKLFIGECYAGRRPSTFKQGLDLLCIERTELMNKTDARVELRKARDSLFETGHPNEHQAGGTLIENGPYLLKTVHVKSVCLVHED
jgi:hypothetical protein